MLERNCAGLLDHYGSYYRPAVPADAMTTCLCLCLWSYGTITIWPFLHVLLFFYIIVKYFMSICKPWSTVYIISC